MAGSLSARLDEVVRELRLGAEAAGCDAFGEFLGALIADLEAGTLRPEPLLPILELAMGAQQRTDYVGLADLLQYELKPLLPKQR